MSLSKVFITPLIHNSSKQITYARVRNPSTILYKNFTQNTRSTLQTQIKKRTIKEILFAPAGDGAFTLGRGALAGGSALGLAALCYYGLGLSRDVGTLDKSILWPEIVRERVRNTYAYFGSSLIFTAGSAYYISKNPKILNMFARNSWISIGLTFVAVIASGALCRSIPYTDEGLFAKHVTWILHNGVLGAVIAPLSMLGGPLLIKAAVYTAGVIGGLSMVAACAPSEKFLSMNGPLAIGLGTVFVASLGSMFLPPTTMLGAGLYSISVYGGLLVFSLFLLYDTQKIVKIAENYPTNQIACPYDPINA
ncbi:unnamed protein product [Gordionus sp. m RMFG-2023]